MTTRREFLGRAAASTVAVVASPSPATRAIDKRDMEMLRRYQEAEALAARSMAEYELAGREITRLTPADLAEVRRIIERGVR